MCLSRNKLKTFKDNDNVRIGYKIFDKKYNTYYNPYQLCSIRHTMGSWYENKWKAKLHAGCYHLGYDFHHIFYKSGFHFYSSNSPSLFPFMRTSPTNCHRPQVVVECICENITATGEQNLRDAFVAQSYRLMREV